MEVKSGYRQTEIGILPDDWEIQSISAIARIVGGGTPSTVVAEYWDGQIPWVSAGDVSDADGRYVQITAYHISELGLASCPARIVPAGTTIIIARGATVGRMAQLPTSMTFNQTCYGLLSNNGLDKDYLYYSMLFSINSIKALTYGTIFGTITTNSFEEWMLPFPPLPEQHLIAAALSDVDALLAALDALIAKKRLIKQGTMQELLTGKKRLQGFSDKWEVTVMREIGSTYGGMSGKTGEDFIDGMYPYIPFLNILNNPVIDTSYFDFVNISSSERQNKVQKRDLFFNGSSETPEDVGTCSVLLEEVPNLFLNSFCFGFRLHNDSETNGLFLSYFFRSGYGRKLIYSLAQGATRYNLSKSQFLQLEIPYPSFKEQTAIAEVLRDMDGEIAALEQRREKTRLLKQGMMQELLTGRIRLV